MTKPRRQEPTIEELKYLRDTLYVMGGKWKLPILFSLSKGINRFKEIQRSIPGITSRVLSKELKELEMNKIIVRNVNEDIPVRIGYEITDYCESFDPIIRLMINWGREHRSFLSHLDRVKARRLRK
jgi:DNA-binding HxlR family transcriptional regulator